MDVAHGVTHLAERRIGEHQVGVRHERQQRGRRVGVAGVGEHLAVGLDPEAERFDRVIDPVRGDGERPDRERAARPHRAEVELRVHPVRVGRFGERDTVGSRHPGTGVLRTVDRHARQRATRGVVLGDDEQSGQVEAVVGVQMADHDRIDRVQLDVLLQHAERPRPHVEHEVPGAALVLGLHQVGRRR